MFLGLLTRIYETRCCSSRHHQGACAASPAEAGGHSGPCQGQAVCTWSFTLPTGFILPVRLMSALKEISEIPGNKRTGLVRRPDQGWGTWSGPRRTVLSQETPLHEGIFASPSEETQGVRHPVRPKAEGLLTTGILLGWGAVPQPGGHQTLRACPVRPRPRASESVPSHPSGCVRQSSCKDASGPPSAPVSLQQGPRWLLRSHLTFRSEYRGTNHSLRRTCSVQTAWVREHMLSPNQNT